jgi:FSR family fosmidomycin resistance protein-like MFS transporter
MYGLLALLGLCHLLVDASSHFVMIVLLRPTDGGELVALVFAYNFGAFALQPAVGWAVARLGRPRLCMAAGILLAATAILALDQPFVMPLVLTALGNALFHVGGGTLASLVTEDRASGPGLFIAPGVLGVAVGTFAGMSLPEAAWPLFGALLIVAVAGTAMQAREHETAAPAAADRPSSGTAAVLALLLLAIAIRSLLGARAMAQLGGSHEGWALPLAVAAFAGKASGGIRGDRYGWGRTAVVALVVSSVLLVFADVHPAIAALAIVAFQVVTAITLGGLYRVLPGRTPMVFGLASLALFVGFLPVIFHLDVGVEGVPVDSLLALVSAVAIWRALALLDRRPAAVTEVA